MRVFEIAAAVGLMTVASLGVVALSARSQHATAHALPARPLEEPGRHAHGKVRAVDLVKGRIALEGPDAPSELVIDPATKVWSATGAPQSPSELEPGEHVCVTYAEVEGHPVASAIDVCGES